MSVTQREKVCRRCRKRKMRCGGQKPFCQQCVYAKKSGACNYDVGLEKSIIRSLRQNIERLERRLRELGDPEYEYPAKTSLDGQPSPARRRSAIKSLSIDRSFAEAPRGRTRYRIYRISSSPELLRLPRSLSPQLIRYPPPPPLTGKECILQNDSQQEDEHRKRRLLRSRRQDQWRYRKDRQLERAAERDKTGRSEFDAIPSLPILSNRLTERNPILEYGLYFAFKCTFSFATKLDESFRVVATRKAFTFTPTSQSHLRQDTGEEAWGSILRNVHLDSLSRRVLPRRRRPSSPYPASSYSSRSSLSRSSSRSSSSNLPSIPSPPYSTASSPHHSSTSTIHIPNLLSPASPSDSGNDTTRHDHHAPPPSTATLRVYFGEDLFFLIVPGMIEFTALLGMLEHKIGSAGPHKDGPLQLEYKDEDGDLVSLQSTEDVRMMFEQNQNGEEPVRLFATRLLWVN